MKSSRKIGGVVLSFMLLLGACSDSFQSDHSQSDSFQTGSSQIVVLQRRQNLRLVPLKNEVKNLLKTFLWIIQLLNYWIMFQAQMKTYRYSQLRQRKTKKPVHLLLCLFLIAMELVKLSLQVNIQLLIAKKMGYSLITKRLLFLAVFIRFSFFPMVVVFLTHQMLAKNTITFIIGAGT